MKRALSFVIVLAVASAWSPGALAQTTTYNADGTPSMIAPDGGVFDDSRPRGTGAVALADPWAEAAPQAPVEERFDIDCDPDIDVCVDTSTPPAYDDGYDPNAYQQFESALQPYGAWSQDPSYGQVWTPSAQMVGTDFMPYATGGQWVASSDYGFTWVSDYDWGWAPFHYGRWLFLGGLGWSWIPGSIWGPAWVDWRYGNGYCGWAPMPPAGVIVGPPLRSLGTRNPWRFALSTELFRRNPTYLPHHVAASIFSRTSAVRNVRTVSFGNVNARIALGPELSMVSRDMGRAIPAMALRNGAPSALPRAGVVPRAGIALGERSYIRSAPSASQVHLPGVRGDLPAPRMAAPPAYPLGHTYSSPPPRVLQPSYQSPGYRGPSSYQAPSYQVPVYRGPPSYQAPIYRGTPSYQAPSYQAPSYQAPVYRGTPSYQAPSYQAPVYRGTPSYSPPSYQPSQQRPAAPTFAPPASRPAAPSPSFSPGSRRRF